MNAPVPSQLSPGLKKARTLSRLLSAALGIAFCAVALMGIVLVTTMLLGATLWPHLLPADARVAFNSQAFPLASLSLVQKLGILLTFLLRFGPTAAALYFGRRVFLGLATGEIFTAPTVALLRTTSLWMIVAACASSVDQLVFNVSIGRGAHGLSFNPALLFFGVCTYVAAYVLAEAHHLAEDSASIV